MKKVIFLFLSAFYSVLIFAQKEKIEISADDGKLKIQKTEAWYASPWVWVVGAAVFILLLVALTRGGSRRDS